jgi:hypothetical protein
VGVSGNEGTGIDGVGGKRFVALLNALANNRENNDVVFHVDIRHWRHAGVWHYQRHVAGIALGLYFGSLNRGLDGVPLPAPEQ